MMNSPPDIGVANASSVARERRSFFFLCAAAVIVIYSPVLWLLFRHALDAEIHQHIILVPFICVYLICTAQRRHQLSVPAEPSRLAAGASAFAAVLLAVTAWTLYKSAAISDNDALSLASISFLMVLFGVALLSFGWTFLRPFIFPLAFLLFAVPLPDALVHYASVFLQHASAHAAWLLLRLSGMPFTRDGFFFHLPGLDIVVAEQCSGFRSTYVLFIASFLAGELLVQRPLNKMLLVAAVLPIAILRNGFRVALISWLTVKVNPHIIEGPLHHRGGPIFFLLGLIPFFGCLWWLRRREAQLSLVRE
jgi:exosortase